MIAGATRETGGQPATSGNGRWHAPRAVRGELAVRAPDAVVVAQGPAGVLSAEEIPPPEDRYHVLDEGLQASGQGGRPLARYAQAVAVVTVEVVASGGAANDPAPPGKLPYLPTLRS
jgi:hypothetical protein